MRKLPPIDPGEILLEDFLKPMGISQYRLAKEIDVPPQRIGEIVKGKRSLSADTDLRLCRFSACPTDIGCVPKPPMTPKLHKMFLGKHLRRSNPGRQNRRKWTFMPEAKVCRKFEITKPTSFLAHSPCHSAKPRSAFA